jgi:hypothetical protein
VGNSVARLIPGRLVDLVKNRTGLDVGVAHGAVHTGASRCPAAERVSFAQPFGLLQLPRWSRRLRGPQEP